jgi:hypothetical protein
MKKTCILAFVLVAAASYLSAQQLPRTLAEVPLYPGATAVSVSQDQETDDLDAKSGIARKVYQVAAAPEAVADWYAKKLSSRLRDESAGEPSMKVGGFSPAFHDFVFWELDSVEDGYADNTKMYEGSWIVDQIKAKRKKLDDGYISSASFFWLYRKDKKTDVQIDIAVQDATFDRYTAGDPETGEGIGVKKYAPLTEIRIAEQPLVDQTDR